MTASSAPAPQPAGNGHLAYDVVKVCKAIAVAETSNCTDGTALKRNNCHGIMQWDKAGNRSPKYFQTKADSFRDCERIWSKSYGGMPHQIKPGTSRTMADVWTGSDDTDTWLANFTAAYSSL